MPRFAAFLRAVNVGGRVVKMEALKWIFESMGLADVESFIASGNVVFSSKGVKGLDAKIAGELESPEDRFHVRGRDFWWLSKHHQARPAITGRQLEKALGQPTTLRNVNTIRRMAERYGEKKGSGVNRED